MIKRRERAVDSPFANEGVVRGNLAGRAAAAEATELRADFRLALEALMLPGERLERLVALRAGAVGRPPQPAGIVAASDRAVLRLHTPDDLVATGYGVRSLIVPYHAMVAVELSDRFLRGLFVVHTVGDTRIEIGYHALDEKLFTDLARSIRSHIGQAPRP